MTGRSGLSALGWWCVAVGVLVALWALGWSQLGNRVSHVERRMDDSDVSVAVDCDRIVVGTSGASRGYDCRMRSVDGG